MPPGHYFMMGDNRDNSSNSRLAGDQGGVGYVPFENLIGRGEIIFFSIGERHAGLGGLALAVDGALGPHVPARSMTVPAIGPEGVASCGRDRARPRLAGTAPGSSIGSFMNKRVKVELADLEARLGYRFRDRELAALALTHLSAQATGGRSYQRLEFLGDRVLGVVVADHLYRSFPQASEGELSMRLAKLVRRETCAAIAAEWDVGPHVVLGLGEAQGGGRKKAAILSDICEVADRRRFLDGGFEAARDLIVRAWGGRLTADAEPARDAKTAVQEWAQARALAAPRYEEVARSGPAHAPHFVMRVVLPGYESGDGRSELQARRRAGGGAGLSRPLGRRHERHPLRLRRPDRRAERRQVDADQRARRRESVDRHPQGADDARDRARRRHARARRRSSSSTRRASSRPSAGSIARWSPPPGARRRRRRAGAADRRAGRRRRSQA